MDNELDTLVRTIIEVHKEHRKPTFNALGHRTITFQQRMVLNEIETEQHITVSQIARIFGMSLSSTTQLIGRLMKLQLVNRVPDTKDRRVVHLHISDQGKVLLTRIRNEHEAQLKQMFAHLPKKDVGTLQRIYQQLLQGAVQVKKNKDGQ